MQRLASSMDAAPLPVFALDEDACYIYENEAGRVFLGYEPAEIAGKHVTDLIVYDPSLLMVGFADLKHRGYFSGGVRYRHRDGELCDADVNTFAYTLTSGARVFVALVHPVLAVRWRAPEVLLGSPAYVLTGAEMRLLQLLADGFSDPQIADFLGETRDTVGGQVRALLEKMKAPSRTHAAVLAIKNRVLV
jgi:PAS domain S-box-containing protein